MQTLSFDAIGTKWMIDLHSEIAADDFVRLQQRVHERIEEFDRIFSRFRQDSLVSQMAQMSGDYVLPDEGIEMLALYQELYHLTGGTFTPLIATALVDAGYDADYSLKAKKLRKVRAWDEGIVISGKKLFLREPVLFDFGAVGKGKLIDIMAELVEQHGITEYCIDAGGDIRYRGSKQLRIGLENPQNLMQVLGVVKLKNQSVAASAGNRRKWEGYHHIINPHTLSSPSDVLATWVVADTAMLADALATTLFLCEPGIIKEKYAFSYFRLFPNFSFDKSADFPADLYYNK